MRNENVLKPVLAFFAITILVQCVSGVLLFAVKLGFTPESIAGFYLGAEEKFIMPKTFAGLLEITVPHLGAAGAVIFILGHLVSVFARGGRRFMNFILYTCFISAAAGMSAGYLIRFVHPGFIFLKLLSFMLFEFTFAAMILMLLRSFFSGPEARNREGERV